MILRLLEKHIKKSIINKKITLILGARQVGKTTLLKTIGKRLLGKKKILYLDSDTDEGRQTIDTTSLTELRQLLSKTDILVIDEVQRLTNPGLTLKIIYDNLKTKIIATGSSSFELKNKVAESLAGRYIDFILYPFSYDEIKPLTYDINKILLYGQYPEVFLMKTPGEKIILLNKIIESYLFKDIFSFQRIRNSQALKDLVVAISYQIGAEVNENELSNRLKIDRKTVASYLKILEKAFIIRKIYPYSKNPRREIGRRYKIYFIDLGIRNALIGDFNDIKVRSDSGALWENFIMIERIKNSENQRLLTDFYFWRSYGGGEIDLIEKSKTDGKLKAYEIKYQSNTLGRGAKIFTEEHKIPIKIINANNFNKLIF